MNERVIVLCFCIPFLVNSVFNQFVHDDTPAIVRNKDVQGQTSIKDLLLNDYWGKPMSDPSSHKSYRPLTVLTFRLNRLIFGRSPISFHMVNILLHLFMVDRIYEFLIGVKVKNQTSMIAAILFGLHPIHSEAVANCVGRAEVISSHLVLSAIIHRDQPLISGIFTFLAMMSKETGVMCLLILIAIEIISLFREKDENSSVEDRFWDLVTTKVVVWMGFFIAFASVRLLLLQGTYPIFKPADNPAAFAPDKLSRITTKIYYWFVHYWLLFCPSNLSYDWAFGSIPVIRSLADGRLLSIVSFFIFVGLLGFWSLFGLFPEKYRKFSITTTFTKIGYSGFISILLLFLPFVPCMNLFVTVGFAVAERVMYIPSIGYSILIALGIEKLIHRFDSCKKIIQIITFISLVSFGTKNAFRNHAWKNRENLFSSGLTVHRTNAKMFYNLGNFYFKDDQFFEAKLLFNESLRLHPQYASAFNNLGSIVEDEGSEGLKKAEMYYRKAMQINKHNPIAFTNLARILTIQGDYKEAVKVLLHVVHADDHFLTATLKLAKIIDKKGHRNEAEKLFQSVIIQDSKRSSEPLNEYGIFLTNHKRYPDAISVFERAIELDPNDVHPLINLGWIYFELGSLKEAEKIYLQALKVNPIADVYNKLGNLELKKGNKIAAKRYHDLAAELDDGNLEFKVRQAIVLADLGQMSKAVDILKQARSEDRLCKHYRVHLWLARMYAQMEKFVLASSTLETPCYAAPDLEAEELAELKSDLGSYYNALAKSLLGSSQMDSNKNPEESLKQGQHARKRAIEVVEEAVELKPGDANMRVKLAQLYLGDRRIEIGEKILYKALLINPNHAGALDLIDKIKVGKEKTKELHGINI